MTESSRLSTALADRYTIERELGAGGMATVYLAHDLRHDRKVAVKVLRPELAAVIGADRFLAEIKTTANLQHPHILPLFDSGVAESFLYYVMPYVEGISLRDRMAREKQLPIAEAVRITSEIAAALDYAHRHGVIHRDIKPENILLHDGSALVADFGIALAASKAGTRMTETGMSLGTPSYMSPEQAMGERDLDARSDVYALGCVAYEMLTGEPPFSGPTAQAIVAKVMTSEPVGAASLRKTIPPHVADAVHTALQKLPADRFSTAAEFAAALGDPAAAARTTVYGHAGSRRRAFGAAPIAALTVVVLAAGLAVGRFTASSGGASGIADVVMATLDMGDSVAVRPIGNIRLAISPTGNRVAFIGSVGAEAGLFVRELGAPVARLLPDTKGAFAPFFSPDGESVGFFTDARGRVAMKVIPATGGVARTIVDDSLSSFGGADWGDDGNIYYTTASRSIARVSSAGGAITLLARPDSARSVKELDFPQVLPGSRYALLMLWNGSPSSNKIGLLDLKTRKYEAIVDGSYPRFLPPNQLLFGASGGRVLLAHLDPSAGKLTDVPTLVLQNVQDESTNGTTEFAVSRAGTLVYERHVGGEMGVTWVDHAGALVRVDSSFQGSFLSPALSPDGSQFALAIGNASGSAVWVRQFASRAAAQLSGDVKDAERPVFTPDGRFVAFLGKGQRGREAWIRRADGSDNLAPMFRKFIALDEVAYDPTGRYVVLRSEGSGQGTRYLMIQQRGVDSEPRVLLKARYDIYSPTIAPGGRWIAFGSEESGSREIYVRPFPNVDSAKYVVSVNGGVEPQWSRDGTELFFRNPRGDMYAVPVTSGTTFTHAAPKLLFTRPVLALQDFSRNYDVSADGKHFLMLGGGGGETNQLDIIFNFRKQLELAGKAAK